MQCSVCSSGDADLTRVEYQVEEIERVPLCGDCRDEFRKGDLVEDVSVVDA